MGPGTLAELISPRVIRLHYGELQVAEGKKSELEIRGALDESTRPPGDKATLYRVGRDRKLAITPNKPIWLRGFEGASTNESIGSLITKVGDLDVPLTIGYHKVKVEVRDQIARTTIEESFVNHTRSRLEGVFHFPLPQDASISGFGMWIHGELVEADVVEKQRAREIYETILRERRDPGLLEWTGGNIFKARVFPIEPHSEKRIKIVYTQVLPLRANQYRYSYALRSEMLRKTPLRELSIDVLVHSALPLKTIDSPTHPVRIEQTGRSASVQFSAQEYSPTRDFELVCEVDRRASDVVTIPHRRGDDGYFMMQLMPPSAEGAWQREVLPDGEPLEILLVCDTSGSMDKENRKTQREFVAAVLSSLGPDDRFNIAACDAECKWLFDKPVSIDSENVVRARGWLDARMSLGWTDLDGAFESIQRRVGENSHVVYVGDGVVSARDVSAQEFAERVRRLYRKNARGTFHAVSTGSSFEFVVLKAMASLGRGSVRSIGSGQTPMSIALELLHEIARPGLSDVNVEFRGIRVAAVYPDELPNLAAGTQQILIGRYLPTGDDQAGEIVVTGRRGEETVTYSAKIPLRDAEKGNSFIPRLWARAHLDHLLQQGSSPLIKDEIIGLSEEFHIITPYTSLLVLETDEDRERFGVKRRFEMRDGERFFADGRDAARYELTQKVIREAGNWRLGLRHRVLRQLAMLGRDRQAVQRMNQLAQMSTSTASSKPMGASGPVSYDYAPGAVLRGGLGGGAFGGGGFDGGVSLALRDLDGVDHQLPLSGPVDANSPMPADGLVTEDLVTVSLDPFGAAGEGLEFADAISGLGANLSAEKSDMFFARQSLAAHGRRDNLAVTGGLEVFGARSRLPMRGLTLAGEQLAYGGYAWNGAGYYTPNYVAWIQTVFPSLPAPPPKVVAQPKLKKSLWSPEAVALSKSLLRNDWLQNLKGGLEIRRVNESFDPRWNRQTGHNDSLDLYAPDAWLTWSVSAGNGKTINWLDEKERGAISETFSLGRVRKAETGDRRKSIDLGDHMFGNGLHHTYRTHDVEVVDGDKVTRLLLTHRDSPEKTLRISIDTEKNLIVKFESLSSGNVQWTKTHSGFVQIQGKWLATNWESVDAEGRPTATATATVKQLTDAQLAARQGEELAIRNRIAFLHHPSPTIQEAETADANGSAGFDERLVLIVRASQIQKWDEVLKQFEKLEDLLGDKAGLRWMRLEILKSARRNAEALGLLQEEAARLQKTQPADLARAQHLVNSASSIADANETLGLVLRLKPVYDRQPDYSSAKWAWQGHQINSFRNLARIDQLLALEKAHAEAQPWAVSVQTQYARDLGAFGNQQAAYAWLKAILARGQKRYLQSQRDQVWREWADLLQQQGESAAQIEVVGQWLEDKPESEQVYSRYLASLEFDDQMDRAREVALEWMAEGRVDGKLSPAAKAQTGAAINYALGQAWNIYHNIVTPEWHEPLQTTALFFMKHDRHFEFTSRVMDRSQFSNTDAADVVRSTMFHELQKNAATLDPNMLSAYVRWVRSGKPDEDAEDWKPIATVLRQRWDGLKHTEEGNDEKHAIGDSLASVYASFFKEKEYLPYLRERIAQASDVWRDPYVKRLFDALMKQPWTEATEIELFGLLGEIARNSPETRLSTQVESAHRLVDRLLAARAELQQQALQDTGHPERLTRQQLAAKKAEFEKSAREGVAARLAEQSRKHAGLLGKWLQMERMYLDTRLNRNRDSVAAECVAILGDKPPVTRDEDRKERDQRTAEQLATQETAKIVQAALRQRALITYANLAVRKSAKPAWRQWLMAYVDAGIDAGGDDEARWKHLKYQLLVALDEPQELERVVRAWLRDDEYTTTWRWLLARLMAERGEIEEAIPLFEKIEKDSQLAPSDYAALANWYLAQDRKEAFKRARIESLKASEEYHLSNFISQRRQRWQDHRQAMPTELDERVLFAFQALFEKSKNPGNYLHHLRDHYRACRDFRLLHMLPDSVVGRTPQQLYHFLEQLHTTALEEIRKESTADEILAHIAELRQRELTNIDLRALDLLEALVERRSAEVLNQPGPHIEAAVAALKRAFHREWGDGEGRQMAKLLNSLGRLKQAELAAEQFRQLEQLHAREEPGTDDRLFTGWRLASSMFHPYGNRDEGLQRMELVVREYEQSHTGGWPAHANEPLNGYLRMLEASHRHADAEALLKQHLARPANAGQRNWLIEQLTSVYASALESGTRVSLGENAELYRNVIRFIVKRAEQGGDSHRQQVLQRLESVFRTAKRKGLPTLRKDMRTFAFSTLPRLLKQQRNNYRGLIDTWSHRLEELLDARIALEFLIERIENYPRRFLYSWENPWQQFGYRIGRLRKKVGGLGNLEPRLLAIVLRELRRDLETRTQHSRYLYRKNSYFWTEKEADFAKLAEEILAGRRNSERSVRYIAEYFWEGLRHRRRAIEILFVALKNNLLDDSGKAMLVDWLHHYEVKRYAESIAILEGLVERHSVHMHYRCELLTAYHQTSRGEQRSELMKDTIKLFRQGGRWNESNLSQLAECSHFNHLNQRTVQLLGELIPMHQRSHPTRGIGEGTLSNYYTWLADAHSNLKQTEQAVDAAAAAIVSWGPNIGQRRYAVERLEAVMKTARDLDDYVALIDRRAEKSGEDSPIIRRSIGKAYAEKKEHKKAVDQLRIAVELQAGDVEAHKLLMASYDALGDKQGAVRQLLELIDVDRHNLSHYVEVERRLRGDKQLAERAATAIVEASPSEAEFHEALAKVRGEKKQYAAALVHWQQVAELRSLEPNGLINLAKAQLQAGQHQAADKTIARLRSTDWPSRFDGEVGNALEELSRLREQ